jgi:hypothetical protein
VLGAGPIAVRSAYCAKCPGVRCAHRIGVSSVAQPPSSWSIFRSVSRTLFPTPAGDVVFQGGGGAGIEAGLEGIGQASRGVAANESTDGFAPGGDGGDLAEAGETTAQGVGGSAGNAVDGDSFITFDVLGTITGARVN